MRMDSTTWGPQLQTPDHPWFLNWSEEQRKATDLMSEEISLHNMVKADQQCTVLLNHVRLYKHIAKP